MSGCTRRDCTTDMTIEEIDRLTLEAIRDYLDPLVPDKAKILERISELNREAKEVYGDPHGP